MNTTRGLWLLVARASVGVMFFLSGWGKAANPKRFAADFAAWGIPEPDLASTVTAWAELVLGALLVLGLLTRFAAAGLAVTMLGAIYYSVWPAATEASTTVTGFLSQFFYSPEWLLLLVLLALAGAGPGRFALDEAFGVEAGCSAGDGPADQSDGAANRTRFPSGSRTVTVLEPHGFR